MLLGLLSDSHGRSAPVRKAITLFDRLGVEHVIHCGDVGGAAVFDELIGRSVSFVWGNMDFPDQGLLAYLAAVGIAAPKGSPLCLTISGKSFAVYHGHEPGFHSARAGPDVDYVLHGHTHTPRDERRGRTRIINPGALHRARPKTVATLRVPQDELTFYEIDTN